MKTINYRFLFYVSLCIMALFIDTTETFAAPPEQTSPIIDLHWQGPRVLISGEHYLGSRVMATDNAGRDLTDKIVVKSTINPQKPGEYTVVYNVTDHAGNKAKSVKQTVYVIPPNQHIFYVSTHGKDDPKGGSSEKTAWRTVTYAAQRAKAGDTVYVKAGSYGNERVVVANNGTAKAPIIFEGYKKRPGDISSFSWKFSEKEYTLGIKNSQIPTFIASSRRKSTGFFIKNKQYIRIKNFQLKHYAYAILIGGKNAKYNVIDNIYGEDLGTRRDNKATATEFYGTGRGIMVGEQANHNIIRNSTVLNAEIEAFTITGSNNTVDNCRAYANYDDKYRNGTDYYFVMEGSYNQILNSVAIKKAHLQHGGHGFIFKSHSTGGLYKNCHAHNMSLSFQFRHHNVCHNVIEDCKATGDKDSGARGVFFRDGASHNRVIRFTAIGLRHAFMFQERNEDPGNKQGFASSDNLIEDSLVKKNTNAFILLNPTVNKSRNGRARNTIFRHVVFEGDRKSKMTGIFYSLCDPINMRFEKCVFKNARTYSVPTSSMKGSGKAIFIKPKTVNIGFTFPSYALK